jgi:aldehyde dehydrogenase (NAD+)
MTGIAETIGLQRKYFNSGETLDIAFRRKTLRKLKTCILDMENEILQALNCDLGKCECEGYMSEVGMVLDELSYMEKNVKRFAKSRKVRTPLSQFPAKSYMLPVPYGVVLIMSPWNYPFTLTIDPLIDAIAAGNTVIVKPSAYSPASSAVIKKLLSSCFPPEYISVVEGGREVNQELLDQKFDYIFFTGGKTVGKLVLEKASRYLTPVTLELGGKSPCIVDETANLKIAAARIVFGKFLNAGQTCVAPDYLLIQENIKDKLIPYIADEIRRQFGDNPLDNPSYGKIINDKHFNRLLGLMEGEKAVIGGKHNGIDRIEPTVLDGITLESPVMQEEIFGPILPVLTFKNIDEAIGIISRNPTPLALYIFTEDKETEHRVLTQVAFGGGCVNDTIVHLATNQMGFGGVGESGTGSYHGKYGFDTFSHYKSIVKKSTLFDIPVRYQPYNAKKMKLLKWFLK